MTTLDFEIKNIEWWDEKNQDKERCIQYDVDFEHEVVEHITHGELLEVENHD